MANGLGDVLGDRVRELVGSVALLIRVDVPNVIDIEGLNAAVQQLGDSSH